MRVMSIKEIIPQISLIGVIEDGSLVFINEEGKFYVCDIEVLREQTEAMQDLIAKDSTPKKGEN